ncbi:hypothetical protein DRQ09_09075, partial [candidate division KSB1 bacterium]
MRKILILCLSFLLIIIRGNLFSQTSCLLSEKICNSILNEYSGERTLDLIREIAKYNRIDGSPGYHKSALLLKEKLEEIGLDKINIEEFISDGTNKYFSLRSRYGWDAKKGELWIVDPETGQQKVKLADFSEVNTSLANYSISVDTVTEVVDIGNGLDDEDYQNKDIKGKIVLTSSPPYLIQEKAVGEYGAKGIISYWTDPNRTHLPTLINWLDTNNNWTENRTFGFILSFENGLKLKKLLQEKKKLKVHAVVNADLIYSKLENLTAIIPGTRYPDEELLLIAHLCHYKPGANDNASGSASLFEIASTIKELVRKRIIPPPQRTIRFMWVPENYGTVAHLSAHPDFSKKTIACINMDMVGENLKKCDSIFRIFRTPDSIPTYLNDLVVNLTRYIDTRIIRSPTGGYYYFNYRVMPAIYGSDHYWINDGGIGVPAVSLVHWPDNFYHTHQDTPDKCDPVELKRVGFIALGSIIFLANINPQQTIALTEEVAAQGIKRISESSRKGIQALSRIDSDNLDRLFYLVQNKINFTIDREKNAVLSTKIFIKNEDYRNYIDNIARRVESTGNNIKTNTVKYYEFLCSRFGKEPRVRALTETEKEADRIIPKRTKLFLSALWKNYLKEANIPEEDFKTVDDFVSSMKDANMKIYEIMNFIDGKRTLLEIRDRVSTE